MPCHFVVSKQPQQWETRDSVIGFLSISDEVLKAVSPAQESDNAAQKQHANVEQHDSIVTQYKEIIREQV